MWFHHRDKTLIERRRLPGGATMACDLADYNESWNWMRLHDKNELSVLRSLLRPGDTFVDIGAHVGVWSLEAGAAVGKSGKVIAIEPNPATFQKLQRNLKLNPELTQWSSLECAVSAKAGTAVLRIDEMSECCSVGANPNDGIAVATASVDELMKGAPCHGLKIDVEGHELSVIEGAASTLEHYHPWLCVEFNNTIHKLPSIDQWPVHDRLSRYGYRCWPFQDAAIRDRRPNLPADFTCEGFVNLFYAAEC